MSWDVTLNGAGPVEWFDDGGIREFGGSTDAWLNVTYNYGAHFRTGFDDQDGGPNILGRMLDGKRASDTVGLLERAVAKLGADRTQNYWDSSPGNAGHALSILLGWARQYPDAKWEVS